MTAALLLTLALQAQGTAPSVAARAAQAWTINENNTIVWDGKPYIPFGAEVTASPDSIEAAAKAGVQDVLVDLPEDTATWGPAIKSLEANGLRYMLRFRSEPALAEAALVDPAGFRVQNIERPTHIDLALEDCSEALLVMAVVRDGSVRWSKRVKVTNGRLVLDADPVVGILHTLLVYPLVRSIETPDFFDGIDIHRDGMLAALKASPPGAGLRGYIDPMGQGLRFPGPDSAAVPQSRLFQAELAAYLKSKYASLDTALRAWAVGANDVSSYAQLARTVPLWSESRGVPNLWDVETDRLYVVDRRTSLAWRDIRSVLASVAKRRAENLATNLKALSNAPVVYTWDGWSGLAASLGAGLDGCALRPDTANLAVLIDSASQPIGSGLSRGSAGVTLATSVEPTEGGPGLEDIAAELEGIGVRGVFVTTRTAESLSAVAAIAKARAADTSASEWKVKGLFYPDTARDPASPSRVSGGLWWLPARIPGQRMLFGAGIEGYRLEGPARLLVWSTDQAKKVSFRAADPKAILVSDTDGQPLEVRKKKNEIEFELPTSPVVLSGSEELPVPVSSMSEVTTALTLLLDAFPNLVNPTGNEQYVFAEAVKAFDRSPGNSFQTLKSQLNRVLPRAAPFLWMSASRSPKHNFGESTTLPGSASEAVLQSGMRFTEVGQNLFAEYPMKPRNEGTYEIWVSGTIPDELRQVARMRIGDKVLGPPDKPVSLYGDGLGWYKFGVTELPKSLTTFRFECPTIAGGRVILDVVHVALPGFRPQGPRIPIDWMKSVTAPKPPNLGKGLGGS